MHQYFVGLDVHKQVIAYGKRVAVGRMDPTLNTRDIWVLDLARGVSSRLTFDPADELNPTWSPDGSRIAYSKQLLTGRGIFWKAASGAGAEVPLLQNTDTNHLEDWSPDGNSCSLTSTVSSSPDCPWRGIASKTRF